MSAHCADMHAKALELRRGQSQAHDLREAPQRLSGLSEREGPIPES